MTSIYEQIHDTAATNLQYRVKLYKTLANLKCQHTVQNYLNEVDIDDTNAIKKYVNSLYEMPVILLKHLHISNVEFAGIIHNFETSNNDESCKILSTMFVVKHSRKIEKTDY